MPRGNFIKVRKKFLPKAILRGGNYKKFFSTLPRKMLLPKDQQLCSMMSMISLSVCAMPSCASLPTFLMVFSTPLVTMPSPP